MNYDEQTDAKQGVPTVDERESLMSEYVQTESRLQDLRDRITGLQEDEKELAERRARLRSLIAERLDLTDPAVSRMKSPSPIGINAASGLR